MGKYLTSKKDLEYLDTNSWKYIIGIDEVGRGCWAGPVAVGGFLYTSETKFIKGVHDSKKLDVKTREYLQKKLIEFPHFVEFGEVEEINNIGIGKTIENLIAKIIQQFKELYDPDETGFVIDGQFSRYFGKNTFKLIRADSTFYSVAAASIVAKVQRDWKMIELHKAYPEYYFNRNKGYATLTHRTILSQIGPSDLHRTSFEPIRKLREQLQISNF